MVDRRTLNRAAIPGSIVKYIRTGYRLPFPFSSTESQLINISKSGACVEGELSSKTGDIVILKILFPDGTKLKLRGQIRWKDREAMGIQFKPFGARGTYNSLKALNYLRTLSGQAMEIQNSSGEDRSISAPN